MERAPPLLRDPIVIGMCAELVGEIGPVLFLGTAPGAVAAVIRVVMWVRPFITGARRSSEQRPYLPGSTVAWDRALSSPCPRSTVGWAESTGRGSVRGSGLWSSVAWGTARPPQQWVGGGQEDLCRPVAIHAYVLYFGKPGMLKERVAGRGAAPHRAGFEMAGGYDALTQALSQIILGGDGDADKRGRFADRPEPGG